MPTLVAWHTFARVVCNQIDAGCIVLALGCQAFINVQGAIVGFVAGRTRAGVVFRWVRACAAVFAVLKNIFVLENYERFDIAGIAFTLTAWKHRMHPSSGFVEFNRKCDRGRILST